jgi:hypothetical protein
VDLEDVVFSKDRVKQIVKADEEREKNVVPIQEALAVSDNTNLRSLMLNVIKGNIEQSLSSISLALDSEDSETSHYAASVLSKELNEFRLNVRKLQQEVKKEDEENLEDTSHRDEYGVLLINYMDKFLKQHVFTNVEQEYFVKIMADTGEMVYQDEIERKENTAKEEALRLEEEKRLLQEQKNMKEIEKAKYKLKERAKQIEPMFRARGVKQIEEEAKPITLNEQQYSSIALRLIESKDYVNARVWCERSLQDFPNVLSSYQCMMKLLFLLEEKEEFLKVLHRLKKSGITIDNETLEMIRIFQ